MNKINLRRQFRSGVVFDNLARVWFSGISYLLIVVALRIATEITGSNVVYVISVMSGALLLFWLQERLFNALVWARSAGLFFNIPLLHISIAFALLFGPVMFLFIYPFIDALVLVQMD